MSSDTFLGIDFSGNHDMWGPGCSKSNVWIAEVQAGNVLALRELYRVQQLSGAGHPFDRLAARLSAGGYAGAGIDAPFSVPQKYVPAGGHPVLRSKIASPSAATSRRFVNGASFVTTLAGTPRVEPPKPLRTTEEHWSSLGVNTRSTMWAGIRGGAPMTAACVTLLHRAARPMWPWSSETRGFLVEAFPAAQLHTWGLPTVKYNGASAEARKTRSAIASVLGSHVTLGQFAPTVLAEADALDAVLCAFAALAVVTARIAVPPVTSSDEGWIAVHA